MRSTTIPAQITTVEDTIAGSLTMKQLLLLISPVIFAIVFYMILPPFFHFSVLKIILCSVITFISLGLAIRIKSKLILDWLQILTTYSMRAKYFVYDKNEFADRIELPVEKKDLELIQDVKKETITVAPSYLSSLEHVSLPPNFTVIFSPKRKGGMRVAVYEVQK